MNGSNERQTMTTSTIYVLYQVFHSDMESPNKVLLGCFTSETIALDNIAVSIQHHFNNSILVRERKKFFRKALEGIKSGKISNVKEFSELAKRNYRWSSFELEEIQIDQCDPNRMETLF